MKEVGIHGYVLGAKRATCLARIRFCDKEMATLVRGGSKVAKLLLETVRPSQHPVHHVGLVLIWKSV